MAKLTFYSDTKNLYDNNEELQRLINTFNRIHLVKEINLRNSYGLFSIHLYFTGKLSLPTVFLLVELADRVVNHDYINSYIITKTTVLGRSYKFNTGIVCDVFFHLNEYEKPSLPIELSENLEKL